MRGVGGEQGRGVDDVVGGSGWNGGGGGGGGGCGGHVGDLELFWRVNWDFDVMGFLGHQMLSERSS